MPMLYHLSMSAITFLSLHREVGSNASDIVTNNVFALNLTTYPLLDKATSSSPIHENPDNFGFDGLHREDLRSEERAGLLPQRVSAYVYKLRMGVSSRLLLHPKRVMKTCGIEAKTKGRIGVHDFWRWLEYVDLYRARGKQFSDSALVDVLVKKSIPEAQLVNLFHSLRFYREMEDRANVFQRILAQKCSPATSEYMISVWLKSNLNPRDVFRILGNGWRDINVSSPSVILWLRYTEAFRIKNGGDAYPVEQTGEDLFLQRYTLAQSLTFLEKARQEQDLVQLANELEEYVNEHTHALPKLLAAAA
uniref:RXLR phytopathogen effector protein WY-domain domain-containing protein n=1 Tax=Peronospora matthiolae TaxID=2874970 RepID=A0AAV1VIQ7_9STRA